MTTVKITELPAINVINANTSDTVLVGVDIPTNITGKITLTTLAAGLYSNNKLAVGNNYTILPNVVGQFTGNSTTYIQVNLENQTASGSGDFVVTANDGSDTDHFIDMGINGSTYSDSTYSATKEHDGYMYVSSSGTNKGNLIVGTTNSTGRINFVVGGMQSENIIGFIDSSGISFNSINAVVSANAASANSVVNTRISSNVATLRSEITSNVSALNGSITSNNTTVTNLSQAAFNKANSALANTSGIFAGNLDIRGNIIAYSIASSNITSFVSDVTPAGNALVEIVGSAGGIQQAPSNDGYMLHITNKPNLPSRIVSDAFGSTNNYTVIAGRSARGTAAAPTATQNNDVLMRITGNGWGTTGFAPLGVARIDVVATENYTDTARGSKIVIYNTIDGSNTVAAIASFNADSVTFTGLVNPAKGFIYTPRILTGAQTAINIDFASDSTVRATFNASVVFSFSNYTTGKVVETWLTNTAGNGQTITHGCLANNSTTGSTTLSVASGRSAKLQYFSIDGDLANVFVAITYA